MAILTGFIVCENVESIFPQSAGYEPKIKIIGPMSDIRLKFLPTLYSMNLVICLDEFQDDRKKMIRVAFRYKDHMVLDTTPFDLEALMINTLNDHSAVFTLTMTNIEIKDPGTYYFDVFYNDKMLGSIPYIVRLKVPEQEGA